jgi:hypothetical protein
MSGHIHHPGTEELADYQAGVVSGTRSKRLAAHVAECPVCASVSDQLVAVSAELAAPPKLTIPGGVERRITVALLNEAAARDMEARQATGARRANPDVIPGRPARMWSRRVPVFSRAFTVPLGILVPAAACLVLAVAGYALSLPTGSSSHLTASAGSAAGSGEHRGTLSSGREHATAFVVTASRTDYRPTTLRSQVRQELQASVSSPSVAPAPMETGSGAQSMTPQGSASEGPGSALSPAGKGSDDTTPSGSLVGCVMRLTGDQEPAMVVRAAYDSHPAYVIAVADHAWVVALNCTAAHPSVITSVALSPAA